MNYVISYPRSGWHWFVLKAAVFCRECLGLDFHPGDGLGVISEGKYPRYPGKLLYQSHFGYDIPDKSGWCNTSAWLEQNRTSRHFVLLRDAKAVINSLHHFLIYYNYPGVDNREHRVNPDCFVRGDWGVDRYCRYLNQVDDIIGELDRPPFFFYYEDMFSAEFINTLIEVLGINFSYSNEQAECVRRGASMKYLESGKSIDVGPHDVPADGKHGILRTGIKDDYKRNMSLEVQDYIDNYLTKYCRLTQYCDFYL